MKCSIMQYFIWVFTVCQRGILESLVYKSLSICTKATMCLHLHLYFVYASKRVCVPPTTKVIWRQGHGFRVSSDRLEEPWIELRTPGHKAGTLSTTLSHLLPAVKALVSLHICADLPELSLLADAINTESCVPVNMFSLDKSYHNLSVVCMFV